MTTRPAGDAPPHRSRLARDVLSLALMGTGAAALFTAAALAHPLVLMALIGAVLIAIGVQLGIERQAQPGPASRPPVR